MRKVQVITGGTSGMGLACARALSAFGPVVIAGRSASKLEAALEGLRSEGIEAYGTTCDVSKWEDVQNLASFACEQGVIGNVIHAAAVDHQSDPKTIAAVNVGGTVNVTEAFFPVIEDGCLCSFSSCTGYFYQPSDEDLAFWSDPNADGFVEKFTASVHEPQVDTGEESYRHYAASKQFVIVYTRANACRFGERGNRVFSVSPGTFDTPMLSGSERGSVEVAKDMTVLGRIGDPDEMAFLVASLVNPSAAYLTGVDVLMDGGMVARMTLQID